MSGNTMQTTFDFVEEISFEEIKAVWERALWPNKKNGVAKANEWTWKWHTKNLGKDKKMAKEVDPTFICLRSGKEIVAVNSCYESNVEGLFKYWRSRGLWVHPDFRGKEYSCVILTWCLEYARKHGGIYMWTVPRKSALRAYQKVGFVQCSEWFDDGQFGPNCIAAKYL